MTDKKRYIKSIEFTKPLYDDYNDLLKVLQMLYKWETEKLTRNIRNVVSCRIIEITKQIQNMEKKYKKLFNLYEDCMHSFYNKRRRTDEDREEYKEFLFRVSRFCNFVDNI